jgi:hypothetical protein
MVTDIKYESIILYVLDNLNQKVEFVTIHIPVFSIRPKAIWYKGEIYIANAYGDYIKQFLFVASERGVC